MKKNNKILGLLATIIMFTACATPSSSSEALDPSKPLFSTEETTIAFKYDSSFKLADGDWSMTYKTSNGEDFFYETSKFKISENGTKATLKRCIRSNSQTLTDEEVAKYKKYGAKIDGNKISQTNEDVTENLAGTYSIDTVIEKMNFDGVRNNLRTNDTKTKFSAIGKSNFNRKPASTEFYLKKD